MGVRGGGLDARVDAAPDGSVVLILPALPAQLAKVRLSSASTSTRLEMMCHIRTSVASSPLRVTTASPLLTLLTQVLWTAGRAGRLEHILSTQRKAWHPLRLLEVKRGVM